jgi:hypothetical protein
VAERRTLVPARHLAYVDGRWMLIQSRIRILVLIAKILA